MQISEIKKPFTQQQAIAISLIQADLRFLFNDLHDYYHRLLVGQ